MTRTLATASILLLGATPLAQEQPAGPEGARSPRNANYRIEARLAHPEGTIAGSEVITWRNVSASPTSELRFHLYWNAWRNDASTWMRERRLARREEGEQPRPEDRASMDIDHVGVNGASLPFKYIAPDDGNPNDRTVLSVPLAAPVAPGQSIEIQIAWREKVPRTFARTGRIGDYYFIAQWFPKIGVLEDGGWNCHQFHFATEFYSDFGTYDVRLTVPDGWVVGATGRRQSVRSNGDGTATHHFLQEDVHDFAWTTSPDYLEFTRRFEHPTLPPVDMRLLLRPEHRDQEERHFAATAAALRYYGEWYGPYPYGHITIVDPAWQSGAGGMEYPTLFTAGSRWWAPREVTQPEGVTVHEAGHQFWYGIVANNEFEHAWLDEGFNTFSTARTIEQAFAPHYLSERFFGGFVPWVYRDIPLSRAVDGNQLNSYRPAARSDAPATPSYRYWHGTSGRITYSKTALWLATLERHLGWPTLQKIMTTYFQRWAFGHPSPQDFFDVTNEVAGTDLSWFFKEVYFSSNVFDYGVDLLRNERLESGEHETTVVVRRWGEAIFPVDVQVTFEDGTMRRERWDGVDRWKLYRFRSKSPAVQAVVDPDRVLLLDLYYTNNSRTTRPRAGAAATKWMLTWIGWAQDLLMTYGVFV